ncbi:MAG: DNA repair protein RecN [Chloroflexi bacterium]|nr:DNA repair protein RecN [Chloroflexota bacterium]
MLERLSITNFAVARSVVVTPGAGLNVFTGETGAGKSLIVDALAFVFGARRGREVIAAGAERATVEAVLSIEGHPLTVERSVGASGRSSAKVDGQPATLETLQELGSRLVDIHGQSEQLAILRPAVQLGALDAFAGLQPARNAVATTVRALRDVRRDLVSLATDVRERERLVGQLRFESEEIAAAGLMPGEDEVLRMEHARLANASRLIEDAVSALAALDSSDVAEVIRAVTDLAGRDSTAAEVADQGALFEAAAGDLGRALRRYRDAVEDDPARLAAVAERLDLIARLRRKYGDTVAEIVAYGREAEARLASLERVEASAEDLRARESALLHQLSAEATLLSRGRREAASTLVARLAEELRRLGMGGAALAVGFACEDDPAGPPVPSPDYELISAESPEAAAGEPLPRAFTEAGVDRVEFLASFNAGESPRPLASVASGGETSRFLLALTAVLGAAAGPRIVVLDEVDEGVGGRAGSLVGEALGRLAARHQVLCVTHLPQVAAYGGQHYVVTKQSSGGRTWSEVSAVEGEARLDELASMLGGVTSATREAARELLSGASVTATR